MSSLADRLRRLRRDAGLSQHQLAERAHVGRRTIASIEAGHHHPNRSTIHLLALALGIADEDLTDGDEEAA